MTSSAHDASGFTGAGLATRRATPARDAARDAFAAASVDALLALATSSARRFTSATAAERTRALYLAAGRTERRTDPNADTVVEGCTTPSRLQLTVHPRTPGVFATPRMARPSLAAAAAAAGKDDEARAGAAPAPTGRASRPCGATPASRGQRVRDRHQAEHALSAPSAFAALAVGLTEIGRLVEASPPSETVESGMVDLGKTCCEKREERETAGAQQRRPRDVPATLTGRFRAALAVGKTYSYLEIHSSSR